MDNNFEERIYALFVDVELEKTANKNAGEIIKDLYSKKYEYPTLRNCDFSVGSAEFKKEIINIFHDNADILSGRILNFNVILKILHLLFERVNNNLKMEEKEDCEFDYFVALKEAVISICKNENNRFATCLFNMLFLGSINRLLFVSKSYFSSAEIHNINKRIAYWSDITNYIDESNVVEFFDQYCPYWEIKEASLAFFNYLCILSEKTNQYDKYKGMFNAELTILLNSTVLDFYKNPARLKKIKIKEIPKDILISRIGKHGIEELILCLENNSKLKSELLSVYSECFTLKDKNTFLVDLIFNNFYFSKISDLNFIVKNGFKETVGKMEEEHFFALIKQRNINLNSSLIEKGAILYSVKNKTNDDKIRYIFKKLKRAVI